jgi:hypothetical protein
MRSNWEASVIVLVPIVIAVLHRRIAVESVVDVWRHIRVTGGQRRKVQHGCKFLTIDAAEELQAKSVPEWNQNGGEESFMVSLSGITCNLVDIYQSTGPRYLHVIAGHPRAFYKVNP